MQEDTISKSMIAASLAEEILFDAGVLVSLIPGQKGDPRDVALEIIKQEYGELMYPEKG